MYKTLHAERQVRKQVMCSGSSCTARQLSNLVGKYSTLIVQYVKHQILGENITERTHKLRIMSRDQKHTSNACSKQHTKTLMACKSLDLNSIDHLVDLLKCKVLAQLLQLNLRELTRVIHQMCATIPLQYIHRHNLSISTLYLTVDATSGGCTILHDYEKDRH